MADQQEFYNFLSNFLHLLRIGKSAQLVFECKEGLAHVHLHHNLGHHLPQPQRHDRHRHQGPSRLRRRARRAVARAAAVAAAEDKEGSIEKGAANFDDAENATGVLEIDHKACQVIPSMLASHQDQATQVLTSPHQVHDAAVQAVPPPVVHHVPAKKLSICQVQTTSIPPKPVYHPAIIRACLSMFGKKPSELNNEEIGKFNEYRAWKKIKGEEIETDVLYNPASGNEPCLHCGHPT